MRQQRMCRRQLLLRLFLSILLLVLTTTIPTTNAEDYAAVDDDAYTDDAVAVADDDATTDDDYTTDDAMSQMEVCEDSKIEVTSVYMLCDSPGTFYYGSGKYRNSATCRAGDKAKITLTFDIVEDLEDADPLLTLKAKGDSEEVTIYRNARLCYLGTLKSTSGSSCAAAGSYTVSSQFYWSNENSNYDTSSQAFSPYISVGYHEEKNPDVYDLGGANTDKCEGDSVTTWTPTVINGSASPVFSFLWSFLILIGTIGILGMFAWYLWRRPTSTDTFAQHYQDTLSMNDAHRKIVLVGSDKGLVDF